MKTFVAALSCLAACGGRPAAPPAAPPNATVELTWIVHPIDPALVNEQGWPLAPLEVKVGSEIRKLAPQVGMFSPANQSVCHAGHEGHAYPLEPDELAKVTFYEGGAAGYLVRRVGDRLVLFEWSQSEVCEDPRTQETVGCPLHTTPIQRLDVSAARVIQHVEIVDRAGGRAPLDCSKSFRDLWPAPRAP